MMGKYLVSDTVEIKINLNSGKGIGRSWGCDLSKRYVEINSEYILHSFRLFAAQSIRKNSKTT